mmetsp:Transcript_4189/g.5166  ORF Transcript_4189/g.5166 Transcript_4189/m.5166 type:complete len:228 (-) Transcript_4189:1082-1765(-)
MASNVDDVVDTRHDVDVAFLIHDAGVASRVVAWRLRQVLLDEHLVVAPQAQHKSGRHRQLDDNLAELTWLHLIVFIIEDFEIVARHGLCDRAGEGWEDRPILLNVEQVSADGPGGLRLPPSVVDHSSGKILFEPVDGVGVAALTRHAEAVQAARVPLLCVITLVVLLLEHSHTGGCHEEHVDLVLLDFLPDNAGVGRDWLALEEDRGSTLEQGTVNDVRMADDPANI